MGASGLLYSNCMGAPGKLGLSRNSAQLALTPSPRLALLQWLPKQLRLTQLRPAPLVLFGGSSGLPSSKRTQTLFKWIIQGLQCIRVHISSNSDHLATGVLASPDPCVGSMCPGVGEGREGRAARDPGR